MSIFTPSNIDTKIVKYGCTLEWEDQDKGPVTAKKLEFFICSFHRKTEQTQNSHP